MQPNPDDRHPKHRLLTNRQFGLPWSFRRLLITAVVVAVVGVEPALAQATGNAFCDSQLAKTVKNIFVVIQFGGPLLGGLLAVGAVVALPLTRRSDVKREIKEIRNQGVVWGVIVAPLSTSILQFILNNVVAGGPSCGF